MSTCRDWAAWTRPSLMRRRGFGGVQGWVPDVYPKTGGAILPRPRSVRACRLESEAFSTREDGRMRALRRRIVARSAARGLTPPRLPRRRIHAGAAGRGRPTGPSVLIAEGTTPGSPSQNVATSHSSGLVAECDEALTLVWRDREKLGKQSPPHTTLACTPMAAAQPRGDWKRSAG